MTRSSPRVTAGHQHVQTGVPGGEKGREASLRKQWPRAPQSWQKLSRTLDELQVGPTEGVTADTPPRTSAPGDSWKRQGDGPTEHEGSV